ncbi:hypothetical protein T4B_14241, partial [Trichinella pseudospiralis]
LNFGQRVDNSISGAFNLHHRLSVIFPNFLQLITANRGSPAAEACTSGWVYYSPLLASSGHLIHCSKVCFFVSIFIYFSNFQTYSAANVQTEPSSEAHHLVVRNAALQEQTPCVPDLNGDTSHCAQKQATETAGTITTTIIIIIIIIIIHDNFVSFQLQFSQYPKQNLAVVAVLDAEQIADVEQHRCLCRHHHRPWCTSMEQRPCNLLYRQDADVPVSQDVDADQEDAVVGNEDADVDREDADVDREDAVVGNEDADVDPEDAVAGREDAAVDRELVNVRQRQHHYQHHLWYDPLRYRIV